MKIKFTVIVACLISLVFVTFYGCKKNQPLNDPDEKYQKLPAEIATLAKWYDKQVSQAEDNRFSLSNAPEWDSVVKTQMEDGSLVYASKTFEAKKIVRTLNINKSSENELFGIVKEYEVSDDSNLVTLKIFSLTGSLIEQGIIKPNGNYVRQKVRRLNTMKSMGLSDGNEIGIDDDGNPIVVITAPGGGGGGSFPSNPGVPTNPGIPTVPGFPSDPSGNITLEPIPPVFPAPKNKLCEETFRFKKIIAPKGPKDRGWQETSVKGLSLYVVDDNYFENMWNILTTGTPFVEGVFNLEIGLPGDIPDHAARANVAYAVNKAAIDIERSYGTKGMKALIQSGTIGFTMAKLVEILLSAQIPGSKASSSLSGRTTPTNPVSGVNCK